MNEVLIQQLENKQARENAIGRKFEIMTRMEGLPVNFIKAIYMKTNLFNRMINKNKMTDLEKQNQGYVLYHSLEYGLKNSFDSKLDMEILKNQIR